MTPPKMPIHIGDYRRDTGHLRAAQHGAYLLLLFHHWATGSLPDDDEQLSAIACMTPTEWKKARPVLAAFFKPGWVHDRVLLDLNKANETYQRRAKAGQKGGNATAGLVAGLQPEPSNATAGLKQPITDNLGSKKDSEANASAAEAAIDHRKRLFDQGLPKLMAMTGKGDAAARSFIGKCLKAASDDAVTVLGLIEEAERNQTIDPCAWVAASLKNQPSQGFANGSPQPRPGSVSAVFREIRQQLESDAGRSGETGGNPVFRISSG